MHSSISKHIYIKEILESLSAIFDLEKCSRYDVTFKFKGMENYRHNFAASIPSVVYVCADNTMHISHISLPLKVITDSVNSQLLFGCT